MGAIFSNKSNIFSFKSKAKERKIEAETPAQTPLKQNVIQDTQSFDKQSINRSYRISRPPSLRNSGATCYLNSAFQGISACDIFVKEINELYKKNNVANLKNLQLFKDLINVLNGCSKGEMEISRNQIFSKWKKSGQQDSYELLIYAINHVYKNLRKYKEDVGEIKPRDLDMWLNLDLPMRYKLQYKIECRCKRITYCPLQSDLALHITIPRNKEKYKLFKLLDLYFQPDSIIDYDCEAKDCSETEPTRFVRLCRPMPRTLCVHLQRTFWNGYRMVKMNNEVSFENKLIIKSEFFSDDIKRTMIKAENHFSSNKSEELNTQTENKLINENDEEVINIMKNKEFLIKEEPKSISENCGINETNVDQLKSPKYESSQYDMNEDEVYNLVSVIEHSGCVDGGHYVCYKKVNNKWFLTNDSWVREVNEETVLNCQAYVLFYEKPYPQK